MTDFLALLHNWVFWTMLGGYWVFSAAVGAMETPSTTSGPKYRFLFRFAHLLAGNITRAAMAFKIPGAEQASAQKAGE